MLLPLVLEDSVLPPPQGAHNKASQTPHSRGISLQGGEETQTILCLIGDGHLQGPGAYWELLPEPPKSPGPRPQNSHHLQRKATFPPVPPTGHQDRSQLTMPDCTRRLPAPCDGHERAGNLALCPRRWASAELAHQLSSYSPGKFRGIGEGSK